MLHQGWGSASLPLPLVRWTTLALPVLSTQPPLPLESNVPVSSCSWLLRGEARAADAQSKPLESCPGNLGYAACRGGLLRLFAGPGIGNACRAEPGQCEHALRPAADRQFIALGWAANDAGKADCPSRREIDAGAEAGSHPAGSPNAGIPCRCGACPRDGAIDRCKYLDGTR